MKKYLLILGFIAAFICPNSVAETGIGGYAGVFLKLPVEARPTAMGGAYLGVSDDAAGQLHNPAGIQSIVRKVFTSSYRSMGLGRKLGFLSLLLPTQGESTLGFSWLYAGYGEVEERDGGSKLTGRTISSNEHAFAVSFAKRFEPYLGFGTKLNYYHKRHVDLSVGSIGIDLGAILFIDSLFEYGTMEGKFVTDIQTGVVVKHIAAKYIWETEGAGLSPSQTDDFATVFGFGASCRPANKNILVAFDVEFVAAKFPADSSDSDGSNKVTGNDVSLQFGGEYNFNNRYFIRGGLNDGIITAGAGFRYGFEKVALSINYAFSDDRVGEGNDHIFTFDINF